MTTSILPLLQRQKGHLMLGFAGDIMLGRLVNDYLHEAPPDYPWGDLLPILQATDTNIGNLETTLTMSQEEVPKVFNFKSDPKNVKSLVLARFEQVNLANNHILDYSISGLTDTLQTLDQAGIKHVGAGSSLSDASTPLLFEKGGIRFGMIGFTDNEPDWAATEKKPGVQYVKVGDVEAVSEDIQNLKENVDIVIASIHWGPNMRPEPTRQFIDFAHDLVDLGVDILHGHSAHIFQGVERYRDSLILYDTGDFVDDYAVDPILRNNRSFLFCVEVSKKKVERLVMIPTRIHRFQVTLAKGKEQEEILHHMQNLSAQFGTSLDIEDGCLIS